ncbi:alpha/beta-hydrolase [Lentithecium fluviatile CBS 122367]|uniref:Dipeptidyl-peptidase V n=1 Tax=Lentithecium fluviatile CBS 122367 TaxID=1168545 RepID=A0A6G1JDD5_9PLEO|nr:alpha/beta-hydrolase [Lentithecium fluviatile CBS 122367]
MTRYLGIAAAMAATWAYALTPEQMLSLPRRDVARPNPNGKIALVTTTQYSFEDHANSAVIQVLDLETGNLTDSAFNASEINEIAWLPGSETGIIYINGTNEEIPGGVTIWISDASNASESKLVASLDAPYSGLKVANTSSGNLNFLVNSLAYANGTAFNPKSAPTPRTTARFYDNIYARHWDTWLTKQRYAVFGGTLLGNASYALAESGMRNLLQGINYTTTRSESPVQPFGGSRDYDISSNGATYAFLSKAPHLNKANFTASYIYVGSFNGPSPAVAFNGPETEASEAGHEGASGIPTFSPDGSKLAYIQQDGDYDESDRWKLYVLDISNDGANVSTSNWKGLAPDWNRWPGSIQWAPDSQSIYVTAEDYAIVRAFHVPLSAEADLVPQNLTSGTSVSDISVLPDCSLLVSASSIWTSRNYYLLSTGGEKKNLFSSADVDEALSSLGPHTYSKFFYDGSLPDFDQQLHALVVKPSNFTENETYPLAYIIHGEPQGSNDNFWSYLWNYQLWADQGYVVVAPNPTGSTGFGQELTDAIQGEWGSYPYKDIILAWEYIKEISLIYISNWAQGHDFGREFKALVTHDGTLNTESAYSSEELWFMRHDYNGTPFEPESTYKKWNPLGHIGNFSTPHFVIHNTLDYRLPESDGLMLFNILQTKGVPSRFLNFPDENHGTFDPENSLFWNTEIFNWINHYSKGTDLDTEPIGE